MRSNSHFVLIVFVGFVSLHCVAMGRASRRWIQIQITESGKQSVYAIENEELRDLPPEQYVKLRSQALAGAKAHLAPTVKNPRISSDGLGPAILSALKKQRAYLRKRSAAVSLSSAVKAVPSPTRVSKTSAPMLPANTRVLLPAKLPPGRRSEMLSADSTCPYPMIRSVNGMTTGAIFTPQMPDTHYEIEGCSFGTMPGRVQLEFRPRLLPLETTNPPIMLQLDLPGSWSENEIDVHLDTGISGVPDSTVALVIEFPNGRRAELPNCLFVAARGRPRLLNPIATAWVKLDATTSLFHPIRQLEFVSPPVRGEDVPSDVNGASALVVRSDPGQFAGGEDSYHLSPLNPGWVVESIQLQNYAVTCPGDVSSIARSGSWDVAFDGQGFKVSWASSSCIAYIPPVFRFSMTSSQYAIKVWVVGPVGTEPMRIEF
jgi:hypothetical protein